MMNLLAGCLPPYSVWVLLVMWLVAVAMVYLKVPMGEQFATAAFGALLLAINPQKPSTPPQNGQNTTTK